MNEKNIEALIKNIEAMIKCPHCGSRYSRGNISIIGNTGDAILVQLSCDYCKMPVMATIIAKEFTDKRLEGAVPRFDSLPLNRNIEGESLIAPDELIEMHNFLDSFDGDFEHLFRSEK